MKLAQAKKDTTVAEANGQGEPENVTSISGVSGLPESLEPDPDYEPRFEFRRLHSGDTIKLWRLVRAAQAEDTIRQAAIEGGAGAAQYAVIDVLMGKVEDEVLPWVYDMAGIADKSEEELDADTPIAVFADLANNKDFLRIFVSASRASHAIQRITSLFATRRDSQDPEPSEGDTQTQNS